MKKQTVIAIVLISTAFLIGSQALSQSLVSYVLHPGQSIEVICEQEPNTPIPTLTLIPPTETPTPTTTPTNTPTPTPSDHIYLEAEQATIIGGGVFLDTNASNREYVVLYDDDDDGDNELVRFDIDVPQDQYNIWARARANTYTRVSFSINGNTTTANVGSKSGGEWGWRWIDLGEYDLDGSTTIRTTRMIATHPHIDAILITTSDDTPSAPVTYPPVTHQPYDPNRTFADMLTDRVGEFYWEQDNREQYLAELVEQGTEQRQFSFRSRLYMRDCSPDVEAIEAFRTHNDNATLLFLYNNLYSVHGNREAMMCLGDCPECYLYDENGEIVVNPTNGRWSLDFGNIDVLNYIISQTNLYHDAGINGIEFDSFDILASRVFENGYWNDGNIEIINPRTGRTYTTEQWIVDFRLAMQYIRANIYPDMLIIVNRLAIPQVEEFGDLLNGYVGEGFASASGYNWPSWWFSAGWWEYNLSGLVWSDYNGHYSVLLVDYNDGEPFNHTVEGALLYFSATALMGTRGPDTGIYLAPRYGLWHTDDWPGWENIRLGDFIPLYNYERLDNGVYKREFVNALVYVNPTETRRYIAFDRDYHYLQENGNWSSGTINNTIIVPGQGLILKGE